MLEFELFPQVDDTLTDISLVKYPAIESNFLMFSKENKMAYHFSSDEKMILTGAVLIPQQRIYRRVGDEEYYVYFSADTIRTISQQFLSNFKNSTFTLEHSDLTNEVTIVESWLVEDNKMDKSAALGMDFPKGTWVLSVKVKNPDLWNRIKSGEFQGFSVAGLFRTSDEQAVISEAEDIIRRNDK
jgi:hypothetical protein